MARVELEHVDKVYPGGTRALSDLTLAIDDGELAVLVGPSGCGKSTVLRLIAGLEEATAGTIRIGERVVNERRPQERNVAMVFQDYALYPYLSARGNLEFPLKMRRLSRAGSGSASPWAARWSASPPSSSSTSRSRTSTPSSASRSARRSRTSSSGR